MARRTIATVPGAFHSARVQYDPEYREYRVSLLKPGQPHGPEESAYYTDDKIDAMQTAHAMLACADVNEANQRG